MTMVLVAVVGLTLGQGQANPKGALALMFGIVALYLVVLFFLQTRDVSAAEAADANALALVPADLDNPAMLDEPKLWAALAIHPIDAEAVRARSAIWGSTRSSIHTGMLVCALIFLTVPPIYLFESFVPLIIGGPLIAAVAVWRSARLLARGGDLDEAYERTGRAVAPLGLEVAERPQVTIEPKGVSPYRMGTAVHGALVLEGERHGRHVAIRMPGGRSEVRLALDAPEFELRARDGKVKADKRAPEAVQEALKDVPSSVRWNGVRGSGGGGGIEVNRKRSGSGDWLLDLWLAERLANALGR